MAIDIIKYNPKRKRWEWLRGTLVISSSRSRRVMEHRVPFATVVDDE